MGFEAALLGLGFLMAQKIWAHYGPLPQPTIWAVPGAVISTGRDVTIFCRIPPGMTRVRLTHFEPRGLWYDCTSQGAQEVFEFSLQKMIHINAGIYQCEYYKEGAWSQLKDKLELVVTGVYRQKPSITVELGPQGFSETNVTLHCHIHHFFDTFIFCRGGNASFPQNCSRQKHNTFLIPTMNPGHRRTYRCFVSYEKNFYLWSLPSDPLEILIPDPSSSIVVWASVAAVCFFIFLLLPLFICLYHHWAKCKATNDETRSQVKYKSSSTAVDIEEKHKYGDLEVLQHENCRNMNTQVSAAENSQEVTYAQLCQKTFRENMVPLPSNTLEDTSAQTCVYATLTLSQEKSQR